jgi:hypothetical protein
MIVKLAFSRKKTARITVAKNMKELSLQSKLSTEFKIPIKSVPTYLIAPNVFKKKLSITAPLKA